MEISHLLPCTLLHPLITPLMIGQPLMLICHLICCHSTGRLCMLYSATPDRLYMLPLPTDFTGCLSQQTLHAATPDRLYMLPLPLADSNSNLLPYTLDSRVSMLTILQHICCHSTDSLQFFLCLPWHIACFKLSCVATLWA